VHVLLSGICGTDLELLKGYWAFRGIPGHEFVGEVISAEEPEWIGRMVVGEINCGCGACAACAGGHQRHCTQRTVLGIDGRHGSFAEYLTLPVANLHRVPPGLTAERAVFVEPVAACYRILDQVELTHGMSVVVLGAGRLGLLAAQVLRTSAADVAIVGRSQRKRAIAAALGIEALSPEDAAMRFPRTADVVVEATGSPSGLDTAFALVRPEGTVVMKTTVAGAVPLEVGSLVVHEVRVVGSRCGPFAPAIDALARGVVQVDSLLTAVYPIGQWAQAFDAARAAGALKVLIRPAA
jgi:threonine dehydrogenase-like Zn-dependent dehydrogenase